MRQATVQTGIGPLTVSYLDVPGIEDIIDEVLVRDEYRVARLKESGYEVKNAVDVGAHMGFFAALLKHYYPEARVVAIEPDADLLPCLLANAKVDICCPVAIRHDGRNDFYVSKYSGGSLMYDPTVNFSEEIPKEYEHRKVEVKPFDVVDDWLRGATIDLLKLDCEGSEFDILCNLKESMRQRIRRMVGEYHHIAGYRFIQQIIDMRYPHLLALCLSADPTQTIGLFSAHELKPPGN